MNEIKPKEDKAVLVRDLERLSGALRSDHSLGVCLPTATYTQLQYSALDALRFLSKRKMGRYSK